LWNNPQRRRALLKNGQDLLHHLGQTSAQGFFLFKILKLKADIETVWCEKTPRDDAFIRPLLKNRRK
jgi:hypothetical protein